MALQRPGPEPEPDDSWDSATTGLHAPVRHHRRPVRRLLAVALILIVTALVPTVGVPMLLSREDSDLGADPPARGQPGGQSRASITAGTTAVGVVVTAPATQPSGPASSAGTPVVVPSALPLVVEAEAPQVRLRRADVVPVAGASGGRAVRFTASNGQLRIDGLALAVSGTYKVTVVYAPGGAWSGDVRGVDGPVRISFGAGTGCCAAVSADVALAIGGSLRIGPASGAGAYPAIDRILIDMSD